MKKYVKKPVVIEAIKLTESSVRQCYEFIHGCKIDLSLNVSLDRFDDYVSSVIKNGMDIKTLEDGVDGRAIHVASIGDYIIKGIQGEFYPCKPDIFHATYDEFK